MYKEEIIETLKAFRNSGYKLSEDVSSRVWGNLADAIDSAINYLNDIRDLDNKPKNINL